MIVPVVFLVASSTVVVDPLEARGIDQDGVTGTDVALFVPRLVLTPVRWALTGLFWPVEQSLVFVEEHDVPGEVIDLLYNDERTAAIIPSLSIFSQNGLTIGLTAFHEDLLGHHERLSGSVKFLGRVVQSYELAFEAEHFAGTWLWLEAQGRYEDQPNLRYYFGPGYTLFEEQRVLGRLRLGTVLDIGVGELKLGGSAIYNHRRFDGPLDGQLVSFSDGTDLIEATGDLILDLRNGEASRGVYLEAFAGGVPPQEGYEYVHWGAEAVGYIDLYRGTRIFALRLAIESVEGDNIPFTSLPRLGGPYRLRGHPWDAYRDEKSLLGTFEYRYPIHQSIQGVLFFDLGRVARNYAELFVGSPQTPWHFGAGGGFIFSTAGTELFRLDISYGDGLFFFLTTDALIGNYRRRAERL